MLSTAASNALLKTLEEPPGHVVFVLATTDAQKVLPTIRSRTQHFEFRLLGPETLVGAARPGPRRRRPRRCPTRRSTLAVRRGRGSARDALSALDQVAAGGVVDDDIRRCWPSWPRPWPSATPAGPSWRVAQASRGRPRPASSWPATWPTISARGSWPSVAPDLVAVAGTERAQVEDTARRMGLAAAGPAMEVLGQAQVDMRDAPDHRVHLEVALIRLTHPEADDSPAALLERIERLERALAEGGPSEEAAPVDTARRRGTGSRLGPGRRRQGRGATGAPHRRRRSRPATSAAVEESDVSGPELARRTLGAIKRQTPGRSARGRADAAGSGPRAGTRRGSGDGTGLPVGTGTGLGTLVGSAGWSRRHGAVSRDQLVQVWGDGLLASLPNRARARFRVGRFVAVEDGTAVFALPNETHRSYCEDVRTEVESALGSHFGTAVPLRLVVDDEADGDGPDATGGSGAGPPAAPLPIADIDVDHDAGQPDLLDPAVLAAETELAGAAMSPEQRLKQAFPGAEEV